ncbi:patatin-like phospholipase family protein [Microbispora sp. NPDC088329]|uniref:patatin-like phospholipase family protein n=1 Tax=Microbispora sp. NPDC088329 TaxID=3154869 RepID=UPI003435A04C
MTSDAFGAGSRPSLPEPPEPRAHVGLVLSGGGAKGAYQAGVAACLARHGLELRMICGASIGALNGAILACEKSLKDGAQRLLAVWREVGAVAGRAEAPNPIPPGGPPGPPSSGAWEPPDPSALGQLGSLISNFASPVLRHGFIEDLIVRHVGIAELRTGPRFYVSAYPAAGYDLVVPSWGWLLDVIRAPFTTEGRWLCVNRLAASQVHHAVLASASLPPVLPPREVAGIRYRDGGLFDNLPVGPIAADPDCRFVVVVHLQQGSLWNARDYPGLEVIEIRPTRPLADPGPLGWANGMLDFSPERIEWLIRRGDEDAEDALKPLRAALEATDHLRTSRSLAVEAADALDREFPLDA